MSYNKIIHKVPVQIPNKSGFDMSFENLLTTKVGTLTPVLSHFLLPNDTISLGVKGQVQLPPMATDFYGRVQAKMEAFFCPARLLYGGWQDFMTHPTDNPTYPSGTASHEKVKYLPYCDMPLDQVNFGKLSDYLGIKVRPLDSTGIESVVVPNILPFMAYHKIYDDWYRDSRIQRSLFYRPTSSSEGPSFNKNCAQLPYTSYGGATPVKVDSLLADGSSIFYLRQRNFSKDYFTNSTPYPQAGEGSQLAFTTDSDGNGSFSIASLRVANSLQQWMERNNLAGYRYGDQIKARFGVYPSDAILDRSIYLGSMSFDIYNKSVYQTSGSEQTSNPFNSVGSKYASPMGVGDGSMVDSFTATEHGYLFVIFSIVPTAYYGTGSNKHFGCSVMADFPDPLLAGVGDQITSKSELVENVSTSAILQELIEPNSASGYQFGYTQRFSEYKFINDQIHGELRDGGSLQAFALQRSFSHLLDTELSSAFIEIPTNFMDQVTAVSASMSSYGAWADLYFSFKKASTLPAYSLPTLGEPRDTHTEIIDNGGKRL